MGINSKTVRDLTDKEIDHIKKRVKSKNYPSELSVEESEELRELVQKILLSDFKSAKRICAKAKKLKTRKALMEIIMFLEDEIDEDNHEQILELEDKIKELKDKLKSKASKSIDTSANEKIQSDLNAKSSECVALQIENKGLRQYIEKLEAKSNEPMESITYVNSPTITAKDPSNNCISLPLQIQDIDGLHEKLIELDINYGSVKTTVERMERHLQNAFHNYIQSFSPPIGPESDPIEE